MNGFSCRVWMKMCAVPALQRRPATASFQPSGWFPEPVHNTLRTYAKLFQQGAPTQTVRTVRQGGATPLGQFCVSPT